MPTVTISLTPCLTALVQAKVADGMYSSASEVISEALKNLDLHQEQLDELLLFKHGDALKPGLEDVRLGRFSRMSLDELIVEAEQEDVIG